MAETDAAIARGIARGRADAEAAARTMIFVMPTQLEPRFLADRIMAMVKYDEPEALQWALSVLRGINESRRLREMATAGIDMGDYAAGVVAQSNEFTEAFVELVTPWCSDDPNALARIERLLAGGFTDSDRPWAEALGVMWRSTPWKHEMTIRLRPESAFRDILESRGEIPRSSGDQRKGAPPRNA